MSSLKQIVVKNATTMSLHERFTKIRKNKEATTSSDRVMQQLASNRNRRLAQQMENRPAVAAALRRESIKARLGVPALSVRDRLKLPRAFIARRGRGALTGRSPLTRGLARAAAMDVDVPETRRGRSPFVSNKTTPGRSRSRSRSRQPARTVRSVRSRSRSRARSSSVGRFRARSLSRSRYGGSTLSLRGQFSGRRMNYRRGRGGVVVSHPRADLKSYRPTLTGPLRRRGSFRVRGRGRGRGRGLAAGGGSAGGRGRGRGRGSFRGAGRGRNEIPSREQLDRDLDDYMSRSKANLDKELDTMMSVESWD